MFTDEITDYSNNMIQQNILIDHCHIFYVGSIQARIQEYNPLQKTMNALAFGFGFYPQKYSTIMTAHIKISMHKVIHLFSLYTNQTTPVMLLF